MATIHLPNDFKEFLRLMNTHDVRYLLVGGYAVGYYGYPRATADMDLWVAVGPENAKKLVAVLREFGFASPEVTEAIFLTENRIIRMGMPPVRIELLTTISGVDFEECYRSRAADDLDGVEVSIISLEHLKINKKASGRHKDLDDLENLP
ncbi:MAG: nucleotidyltransferase [Armatimonadetes bacterium]|nr:nucleotidyltransferase [Armatimonadota bacterium]